MKNQSFLIVAGVLAVFAFLFGIAWVSSNNQEVRLRFAIEAKQKANQATFDNMWKKIAQVAEVTDAQKNALKEIFVEHARARTSGGSTDGSVMKWITESVPNVDVSVYKNLQNIITSARDSFSSDQLALLDLKREHDTLLSVFPSVIFVGGRPRIDVQIVTSGRTDGAFSSGKDEDTKVFR